MTFGIYWKLIEGIIIGEIYDVIWYYMIWCNMMWYDMISHYSMRLCDIIECDMI